MVLACWVDAGLPRARSLLALLVAAAVIALPLLLPVSGLAIYPIDAPVLHTIGYTLDTTNDATLASVFLVAIATSAFLAIWVFLVRRRYGFVLLVVAALAFVPADLAVRTSSSETACGGSNSNRWSQRLAPSLADRDLGQADPRCGAFRRAAVRLFIREG